MHSNYYPHHHYYYYIRPVRTVVSQLFFAFCNFFFKSDYQISSALTWLMDFRLQSIQHCGHISILSHKKSKFNFIFCCFRRQSLDLIKSGKQWQIKETSPLSRICWLANYCICHIFCVQIFLWFWTRWGNSWWLNFMIFVMFSLL